MTAGCVIAGLESGVVRIVHWMKLMGRKWQNQKDDLGSVLAASLVVMCGTGFCLAVAAFATGDVSPWVLITVICIPMLFLCAVIRLRRSTARSRTGLSFWNALFRSPPDDGLASQYRPRRVEDGRTQVSSGTNQPISASEARELRLTSASTWVPTQDSRGRSRKGG